MDEDLSKVIHQAKEMINTHDYKGCERLLRKAMSDFPDDAAPHNLMGIMYEKKNDHIGAMKHFRAAWALDPTYKPALRNLDSFGTLFSNNKIFMFDEVDCVLAAGRKVQGD